MLTSSNSQSKLRRPPSGNPSKDTAAAVGNIKTGGLNVGATGTS